MKEVDAYDKLVQARIKALGGGLRSAADPVWLVPDDAAEEIAALNASQEAADKRSAKNDRARYAANFRRRSRGWR